MLSLLYDVRKVTDLDEFSTIKLYEVSAERTLTNELEVT